MMAVSLHAIFAFSRRGQRVFTPLLLGAAMIGVSCRSPAAETAENELSPMPFNRIVASAYAHQDHIWVVGGQINRTESTASVGIYDPAADSWSEGPQLPSPRSTVATAVIGNRGFVIGGIGPNRLLLDDTLSLDSGSSTWRARSRLPAPRYQACAVAVDGRLFLMGGGDFVMTDAAKGRELLEYSLETDRWIRRAPMPVPMRNAGAVALAGKIYVVGGHSFDNRQGGSSACLCYDPQTDRWSSLRSMPTPRTDIAVVRFRDRIFVLGGHPGRDTVESYDPKTDTWKIERPLPEGRMFHTAVALDSGIYVLGGLPGKFYVYHP